MSKRKGNARPPAAAPLRLFGTISRDSTPLPANVPHARAAADFGLGGRAQGQEGMTYSINYKRQGGTSTDIKCKRIASHDRR